MESTVKEDLERFGRMAFVRAADCTEAIKRFHGLLNSPESRVQSPKSAGTRHPDFELLRRVYEWVFVPMSVWPVDVRGLCLHLLDCVESGRRVDERARLLCDFLAEAPPAAVCGPISEYEHAVKAGNYESVIRA